MKKRPAAAPVAAPAPTPGPFPLESNLGQVGAEALRATLLEMVSAGTAGQPIRLDASAVDQLGTGSLQVLLAAAALLQKQEKQLILEQPSPRLCEWARLAGVAWLVESPKAGSVV